MGLPATVLEAPLPGSSKVRVQVGGRAREISTALLDGPPPFVGERLLVHAGLAVGRVGEAAAMEIEALLEGFGSVLSGDGEVASSVKDPSEFTIASKEVP